MNNIKIGDKTIGENNPVFIVAEISANHNQNLDIAIKTIEAVAKTGADAVKLQTYTPDTITIDCNNEYFIIKGSKLWDGKTLYELYKEAYTPWEWHETLFKVANENNLICFSTPFDFTAVDFLEKFNPPAYKISSYEIFDIPLIEYVSKLNKPIIISTGLATENDISDAIVACKKYNNNKIVLLKCTSSYPAPIEKANLATIPDMKKRFDCLVGLSDHSEGYIVPILSVAMGACVIEKHFILDKSIKTPDSEFSLDFNEFTEMVKSIRNAEKAIGSPSYILDAEIIQGRKYARSLFVVKDINKGDVFTSENIRSIRPGVGLHPKYYNEVLGKKAKVNIPRGTPLDWSFIE
ncbi:MAG: pseudaminic acid synthase [Bacteroidales bacterium]|nr:pseudaminic acid synthase [Bacteroidales bacterium]